MQNSNRNCVSVFASVILLVCMHIVLCVPGAVTWGDGQTKHLSD